MNVFVILINAVSKLKSEGVQLQISLDLFLLTDINESLCGFCSTGKKKRAALKD